LLFYDGSYTVLFHDDAIATLTCTSLTVEPDGKVIQTPTPMEGGVLSLAAGGQFIQ